MKTIEVNEIKALNEILGEQYRWWQGSSRRQQSFMALPKAKVEGISLFRRKFAFMALWHAVTDNGCYKDGVNRNYILPEYENGDFIGGVNVVTESIFFETGQGPAYLYQFNKEQFASLSEYTRDNRLMTTEYFLEHHGFYKEYHEPHNSGKWTYRPTDTEPRVLCLKKHQAVIVNLSPIVPAIEYILTPVLIRSLIGLIAVSGELLEGRPLF